MRVRLTHTHEGLATVPSFDFPPLCWPEINSISSLNNTPFTKTKTRTRRKVRKRGDKKKSKQGKGKYERGALKQNKKYLLFSPDLLQIKARSDFFSFSLSSLHPMSLFLLSTVDFFLVLFPVILFSHCSVFAGFHTVPFFRFRSAYSSSPRGMGASSAMRVACSISMICCAVSSTAWRSNSGASTRHRLGSLAIFFASQRKGFSKL